MLCVPLPVSCVSQMYIGGLSQGYYWDLWTIPNTANCQAQVKVPNPRSQQAPSLRNPKISPYKISCIRVSLEIPLLSLAYLSTPDMQFHFTTEEEELLTPVCMQWLRQQTGSAEDKRDLKMPILTISWQHPHVSPPLKLINRAFIIHGRRHGETLSDLMSKTNNNHLMVFCLKMIK